MASIILLVALLVGGRLYLPIWLKDYVNAQIAALENYEGGVEDIDVFLWRGAYQIDGMEIRKKEGGLDKPFVAARTIDLSVEWRALLNGAVVAEIDFYDAGLNFSLTQTGEGEGWPRFVDALSPFDINRLEIHNGSLTFTSPESGPDSLLYIEDIDARVTNLRQVTNEDSALPSPIRITGTSIGGGDILLEGDMNILKDIPDFDLALSLENADLRAFNDYARQYAAIDFESGNIGVYAELAAANGQVTGYVKPIATDISLVDIEQDRNPFNIIWESIASVFVELFENQSQDQFAMRIPIEGNLESPDRDMWSGFFSIFSNAFGGAFTRNPDGTINFEDALEHNSVQN